MKIRKFVAVLGLAGAITAGSAGVANAQVTPSSPAQEHPVVCDHAQDVLARIHERIDDIKARIAQGEARVDKLRQAGHTTRADALAKRIEIVKDRLARVEERLADVEARVDKFCINPAAPTPAA